MNVNDALQTTIRNMTPQQLFDTIYRDHLTQVLNRRAFEAIVSPRQIVAIIDLDSLKYLNDTYGHRTGDSALKELAYWLVRASSREDVYRLSGDEFAVTNPSIEKLERVRGLFPGFSYGIDRGLDKADQQLRVDKTEREASGLRAPRGVCPPWLNGRADPDWMQP